MTTSVENYDAFAQGTNCFYSPSWCPVLGAVVQEWARDMGAQGQDQWLQPLVSRLDGTYDPAKSMIRGYIAADFAVRVFVPLALEATPVASLSALAQRLRALAPVVDPKTAQAACEAAQDAYRVACEADWSYGSVSCAAEAAREAAVAAESVGEDGEDGEDGPFAAVKAALAASQAAYWACVDGAAQDHLIELVFAASDEDDEAELINSARRDMVEAMLAV